MKKTLITLLLTVSLTISGCSFKTERENHGHEWEDIEVPEDEIILIDRYSNYAWGYQDNGTFVLGNGDVYEFDFSNDEFDINDQRDQMELYREVIDNERPIGSIDEDVMKKLYYYAQEIDEDEEFEGEWTACDAGSRTLVVYNGDEYIKLRESGDFTGSLDDRNAKKVVSIYEKKISFNFVHMMDRVF